MRFRSEQHLRRPRDIRDVREHGRRYDCRAFTIWWKIRETPPVVSGSTSPPSSVSAGSHVRVCIIASYASVGRAVLRNRARRRLREVFRQGQNLLPAGCDLLLIARRATTTWPMSELQQRFAEACQRLAPAAPSPKAP